MGLQWTVLVQERTGALTLGVTRDKEESGIEQALRNALSTSACYVRSWHKAAIRAAKLRAAFDSLRS